MSYEIFNRKTQYRGTASVTITKFGQLSFNKAACGILQKNGVKHVFMLWDKERLSIGLKATNDKKDPRAFPIHWSKRGDGAGFSIVTFIKHIEYNASESRVFPVQWDAEQQMLEFKIKQEYYIEGGYVTPYRRKKE